MDQSARERMIDLIRMMLDHTVENGCTPGEAAKFAAKAAGYVEKYQIEEAELRVAKGGSYEDIEVCENALRTGKRVFNPGMNAVVSGLANGVCCKVILLHKDGEAVYGIIGDQMDADYVCQIASSVVPALQIMARMEGGENGCEKAGLVRWMNQYLMGAGAEIRLRIEAERMDRSDARQARADRDARLAGSTTALACVTGETLAVAKKAAVEDMFVKAYPRTRTTYSRSDYNHTAQERGREAGKRVGLRVGLEGK